MPERTSAKSSPAPSPDPDVRLVDVGGQGAPEAQPQSGYDSHIRRVRRAEPSGRIRTPVELDPKWTRGQLVLRGAIVALVVPAFLFVVARLSAGVVGATLGGDVLPALLGAFALVSVAHFLATVWNALRYRAVAPPPDAELPRVTVIVPAYNEGPAVRVALESALSADYPEDKLEILAIDDGSKDDTWDHIEAMAEKSRGRIRALQQPFNQGKREALRRGFLEADGEIVVTVDSDSKLGRQAIRSIVAPMCADPEVSAVAGRVLVLNRLANFWTKLLSARFFITFDLARAAQSRFGAVLCTPGALSAYRLSAVKAVLERWSTQTFLGGPCTIAEDRALTTWILREGYRAVYQRTAVVETIVPTTLSKIFRMMIRWERGNIREDLVMLPLLMTKWRPRDRFWPSLEIVLELVAHPVAWIAAGLALPAILSAGALPVMLGFVALGAVVQSLYILRAERLSEFAYGTAYALLAVVGLMWLFPYSLATVRDGRWLTR